MKFPCGFRGDPPIHTQTKPPRLPLESDISPGQSKLVNAWNASRCSYGLKRYQECGMWRKQTTPWESHRQRKPSWVPCAKGASFIFLTHPWNLVALSKCESRFLSPKLSCWICSTDQSSVQAMAVSSLFLTTSFIVFQRLLICEFANFKHGAGKIGKPLVKGCSATNLWRHMQKRWPSWWPISSWPSWPHRSTWECGWKHHDSGA